MDTRRAWLAAIAFALGLLGGALAFAEEPARGLLPARAGDVPVAVTVMNVGTHDALVRVLVDQIDGTASGSSEMTLAAGAESTRTYVSGPGRFLTSVEASWTGPGPASGRGTARVDGDAAACGARETLHFTVHIDTPRGVSFPRASSACV